MKRFSLSHLADSALLRDLAALLRQERGATADVLAHLAEVDERRLYVPAAYDSMFAYCVGALRFSEDAAYKRIQVARVARRIPGVFEALAEGRVHLTGLGLLAPHITTDNAAELLAAATYKSKGQIELLLAERFPRPDVPALVRALPATPQLAQPIVPIEPGSADRTTQVVANTQTELAPAQVEVPVIPGQVATTPADGPGRVKPLSGRAFSVQFTMDLETHDLLRQAQDLLGNAVARNDIHGVVKRALTLLVEQLERTRRAATARPRPARRPALGSRHVPAAVRRAVWRRDRGQCTFVSDSGRRCEARSGLELDHVQPFARGGSATVSGIRLRCRAHNQYEAERLFGLEFMRHKRASAARA